MILHSYFARRFLRAFGMILAVFLTLIMLVDLIETLRRFEGLEVGFGQIMRLVLLSAPGSISELMPLLMILSTITLFLGLARSSELVVTRAAGRSGLVALIAPAGVAMALGLLTVSTLGPVAAAMTGHANRLSEIYKTGGTASLSISAEGLWLRQGSSMGQTVIHANRYNADASTLYGVTFLAYAPGGGPVRRIEAASARLEQGEWLLRRAKVWPLAAGLNPEAAAASHESLRIASTLTPERIRDTLGTAQGMSVWQLPETIAQLRQAGFSTRRHEVWLQAELARPLFLMAMVLVAAAFTMRHTRFGGTGISVLIAVLLGFGLYFIRNFAQVLGENGQLPVALAAWAPPTASLMLALGLLLHAEDG